MTDWDESARGPGRSEVHVFVLWSEARAAEPRIVADLGERFDILDLIEVTWSPATFAASLTNFYGTALPSGSAKERECGIDPFLVAVVRDRRPRRRPRRVGRRVEWVNARIAKARALYRSWTGDGFKVHASATVSEAERNLVLLFGRRGDSFADRPAHGVRQHRADPIGTNGWDDLDQLLLALEVTSGQRLIRHDSGEIEIEVDDLWWAVRVTGGVDGGGRHQIVVDGEPRTLVLVDRVHG